MTTLDKVQQLKNYYEAINGSEGFFYVKLREIEQEIINQIETEADELQ
jgi:alpha/beta superfamily hydrolase